MKKISLEKPFLTDIKLNRQKRLYNFNTSHLNKENKGNNQILQSSPEKECSFINELVKKSVEKINNLFQQQKLSEIDNKSYNNSKKKNKNKLKEFINIHSINTIEDMNKYNTGINNKNKNEDDLNENVNQNINSGLIVDVSALQRNLKKHSFDFKQLFKPSKESKNQIDYIKKSNQNEKKYVIQSIESYETLFNPKSTIDLQESKENCSPLKIKKNYLFKSDIIKDMTNNDKYSLDQNNLKTMKIRRNKYYSFYRNRNNKSNKINSKNDSKNNSIRRYNSNNYFDISHKRSFSTKEKQIKNDRYNSLRKNNYNYKTSKTSNGINFTNNKIQIINQFKIYATTSTNDKTRLNKSRTQSHFMNINNSQILKQFYSKEFPLKIKTNDILKLMLFLNEYIINNNLLDDYYQEKNRKILDDYSKFLAGKINLNFPIENDISVDDFVNKTKIIQRKWRQIKVMKYLEKNKFEENKEIKKMVINNYIEKAGYKIKKFFGLFHNLVEQFTLLENKNDFNMVDNNINKCFYFVKKIITNNLSNFEKNELYKDYINKVIYLN